jgi:hypothetical protein
MSYVEFSSLERLRCERHGAASTLDLLKKVTGGYAVMATLTKRFFIGREFASQEGVYRSILTMDKPTELTDEVARDLVFVDLNMPGRPKMRWRVSTETRPNTLEARWVMQVSAAFNDTTAIVP